MICPRCGVDLKKEAQGAVEVDRCPSCWGAWLDKGEFPQILATALRSLVFSEEEVDAVFKGLVHDLNNPKPKPDPVLPCPRCGKPMAKVQHNAAKHVTLDRCEEHGLWCDTKELKQAQVAAKALRLLLAQGKAEPA